MIIIVAFIGGIILIVASFPWLKLKGIIENIPTSKIRGSYHGLVEVKGITSGANMIKSPLTG
ncbi:MAG: hypothetical protein K0B07_02050 [DPANN group archaeon]|nr:hypothetical protein [DPANN group archaeon]